MKSKFIAMVLTALCINSFAYAGDDLKSMFANGTLKGEVRLMDFTRNFDKTTKDRNDSALGGLVYYHTAALKGISFGTAFATVNKLSESNHDAVYGILRSDKGKHESFTRLQEYYIQGEWFKTKIKYGAQELFTPLMNVHDIRMAPRTYKGLSLVNNSIENLTLSAYYITDSMGHTDENFIRLSDALANDPGRASSIDHDKAMLIFGASYNIPVTTVKSNVQAWYYTMDDTYRQTFLKAEISKKIGDATLYAKPSLLLQKSQGDELNGKLDTNQYGTSLGVQANGFDVSAYYAHTGDDSVVLPWGDDKVIVQQVLAASRADEDVYAAKIAYDFSNLGLKGFSTYVFHAEYKTPDAGKNKSNDMAETDLNAQYSFSGFLQGLSLRARYAFIDVKQGGEDYKDIRFIASYKFALGK